MKEDQNKKDDKGNDRLKNQDSEQDVNKDIHQENLDNNEDFPNIPDIPDFKELIGMVGGFLDPMMEVNENPIENKKTLEISKNSRDAPASDLKKLFSDDILDSFDNIFSNINLNRIKDQIDNSDAIKKIKKTEKIKDKDLSPQKIVEKILGSTGEIMEEIDFEKDPDDLLSDIVDKVADTLDWGNNELNAQFKNLLEGLTKTTFNSFIGKMPLPSSNNTPLDNQKNTDQKNNIKKPKTTDVTYDSAAVERLSRLLQFVSKIKLKSIAQRMNLSNQDIINIIVGYPDLFDRFIILDDYIVKKNF